MKGSAQLRIAACVSISFLFCFNNIFLGAKSLSAPDDRLAAMPISPAFPRRHDGNGGSASIDMNLARERLNQTLVPDKQWERNHSLPHFYCHIPKTAGYYGFRTLSRLLSESPEYGILPAQEKFRICNVGVAPISRKVKLATHHMGTRCNMYMSEVHYQDLVKEEITPGHAYTIIRNPREHVLSQFFHCTETNEEPKKRETRLRTMTSLEGWLGHWVMALNDTLKFKENRRKFSCYPAIDLQSRYAGFVPQNSADDVQGIQQQFTVIGPMEKLDKLLCVIFIHYAGWLPDACNCSNQQSKNARRRLGADHGVTHHGSTYNTTRFQDAMIEKLVERDQILYGHAKQLFTSQLELVEEYLGVTICDQISN